MSYLSLMVEFWGLFHNVFSPTYSPAAGFASVGWFSSFIGCENVYRLFYLVSVVVIVFVCWLTDVVTVASNIALVKVDVLLAEQPHQSP